MKTTCTGSLPGIFFYAPEEPFGWLSTFSPHQCEINGQQWPTVEHFFQAQKFTDPLLQKLIRSASSPAEAKALAAGRISERRPDWYSIRDQVMLEALRTKFDQHPQLSKALCQTGEHCLIENSIDDLYWGYGADGSGYNRLGELLMRVREELRKNHGNKS